VCVCVCVCVCVSESVSEYARASGGGCVLVRVSEGGCVHVMCACAVCALRDSAAVVRQRARESCTRVALLPC
jgi:hypothetical protein